MVQSSNYIQYTRSSTQYYVWVLLKPGRDTISVYYSTLCTSDKRIVVATNSTRVLQMCSSGVATCTAQIVAVIAGRLGRTATILLPKTWW